MNFLKSGPELKLSELKVPTFLVDLYWDVRDRHLLPLVGLIVVAIVAVPFLLSGGSKSEPVAGGLSAAPSPEAHPASLTVVEAKPGLRDYRKRLRDDTPTDPFEQKYTAPQLAGTQLGGGEGGSTSTTSTVTTTSSGSGSGSSGAESGGSGHSTSTEVTTETGSQPNSGGGGETPPPGHLTLFSFAADVKTVRVHTEPSGVKKTDDPIIRHHVLPPSALPTEKTQVVTYMGISPKTRLPLLLVSDTVSSVFGEAKCLSGAGSCQLLEVEPGFPTTFVLGDGGTRYKITILKIEPVAVTHN